MGQTEEQKKLYFTGNNVPSGRLYYKNEETVTYVIPSNIVDKLIGDLFFHPDDRAISKDNAAVSRKKALSIFCFNKEENVYYYKVVNSTQFRMFFFVILDGLSFQQTYCVASHVKDCINASEIGVLSKFCVTSYVKAACAINLQVIAKLLQNSWTFSVALDMSTHQATSYLDIHIYMYVPKVGDIKNFHILAIPMY